MKGPLFSVRMHGTRGGAHLSGAERIVSEADLERVGALLLQRALKHERGSADTVRLTVEAIPPEAIRRGRLPDLRTVPVADYRTGRAAAAALLGEAGVAGVAVTAALDALCHGPAPDGENMRGAMLIDAATGLRLEPDRRRGVRASRMDLTPAADRRLRLGLARLGLDNAHVREALVLAAKVLAAPGIVAELCWSDDPGYTAGYVASHRHGYVRFPHLKPQGEERGGRAFFWADNGNAIEQTIDFLERSVLLVDTVGALDTLTDEDF